MKWTRLVSILVFVGCTYHNPPPQYAQPGPQPQGPQPQGPGQQGPTTQGPQSQGPQQPAVSDASRPKPTTDPMKPAPPPEEVLPVPIEGEMPKNSVTTDAKLELGVEATITLDARSDIYSSGEKVANASRQGVLPSSITLAKGGGIISFPKVTGKASCVQGTGTDADGGDCAGGDTDLMAAGKLSGIQHHQRTMFLVGVFLGAKPPAKAPPALDFSDGAKGTKFAKLEPVLGQVFYIGDGKPGDPPGDTHDFVIPKGATRLFLGYADGFGFHGTPGAYGDNKGGLSVTVLQRK
jgi:hypothetical protein